MDSIVKLVKDVLAACAQDTTWMTWAMNYRGSKKGARAIAAHSAGFASGVLHGLGMNEADLIFFDRPPPEQPYQWICARAREEAAHAAAAMTDRRRALHVGGARNFLALAAVSKAKRSKTVAKAKAARIKVLPRE